MSAADVRVPTAHGSIRVRRTGRGSRRILCLHPLASSGTFWDRIATGLGQDVTVFAPDARGHGESGWDGAGFTVQDMAGDAADVIEAVGGGPVGVVGMSMGGCVAISLAARRPELVDSLALVDTTSCYGADRAEKWARRAEGARTKRRSDQVGFQLDRWFSADFRATHDPEIDRIVDIFLATDSAAHAAACMALGAFDGTSDLDGIRVPTLVMVGEFDEATPPAMAGVLAAGIPGAALHVVPGVKHLSLIEAPDSWSVLASHLANSPAGH